MLFSPFTSGVFDRCVTVFQHHSVVNDFRLELKEERKHILSGYYLHDVFPVRSYLALVELCPVYHHNGEYGEVM